MTGKRMPMKPILLSGRSAVIRHNIAQECQAPSGTAVTSARRIIFLLSLPAWLAAPRPDAAPRTGGVIVGRAPDVYPHATAGKDTTMTATKGLVVPAGGGKHHEMSSPGRSAALKLLGRETNESIMMFEETVPAGTTSLFHLHRDSDEVAWVLAGEITFKIADEVTVGGPGTCAFMPRDVPH